MCCVGVPVRTIASRRLGGQKDPSSIILDEFAAMPLVFLVVPSQERTWLIMLLGFHFRLFDITNHLLADSLKIFLKVLASSGDDWAAAGLAACTLFAITTLTHSYEAFGP